MQYRHELISLDEGINAKIYIHSVLEVTSHWHQESELLMVLKGDVVVRKENQTHTLHQNDIVLFNPNELHSIKSTNSQNVLLAIQFPTDVIERFYAELNNVHFQINSALDAENHQYDALRKHLAEIIWAYVKKKAWYKLAIEREILSLFETVLSYFPHQISKDSNHQLREHELERLARIVAHVEQNYSNKIQLQEIAAIECVTTHHLSRFFRERMGITFQEYLFDYRLHCAAAKVITTTDKISDIAFECGFTDPKLFYKKFKQKYSLTPIELRKERYTPHSSELNSSYMSVSDNEIYKSLFQYLKKAPSTIIQPETEQPPIPVSFVSQQANLNPIWGKVMTFGCAHEALRPKMQQQMAFMQSKLHFQHVRFQGIFVEQMQIVVNLGQYNWSYVDELFDFLLSIELKPFVCLGYTPDTFASGTQSVAHWKGNITPPQEMVWWQDLLVQFFQHILQRYGEAEVTTWYFEAWNEPDLAGIFWSEDQTTYHQHYLNTYQAIRSVHPGIKIGSPSVSHMSFATSDWLNHFVDFCHENELTPDFFSLHIYPEVYDAFSSLENSGNVIRRSLGEFGSRELITKGKQHIASLAPEEVHVTEWNTSACWGNKLLDTAYMGSFIIHNAIDLINEVDSLAVWTFSDLFEERGPSASTFHGGFGLLTREGIPKPGFHALALLQQLGSIIIERGQDYLITMKGQTVQILMVNYVHFDDLYASGDVSAVEASNPYAAFNDQESKQFAFEVKLPSGHYRLTRHQLNQEHGSAYDDWQRMGSPNPLHVEDVEQLKRIAWPKRTVNTLLHQNESLDLRAVIPPHGVELLTLSPQ
ncbi:GH39 family glycosyl hydrolase [Vibrio sp. DNB22_10_4]